MNNVIKNKKNHLTGGYALQYLDTNTYEYKIIPYNEVSKDY